MKVHIYCNSNPLHLACVNVLWYTFDVHCFVPSSCFQGKKNLENTFFLILFSLINIFAQHTIGVGSGTGGCLLEKIRNSPAFLFCDGVGVEGARERKGPRRRHRRELEDPSEASWCSHIRALPYPRYMRAVPCGPGDSGLHISLLRGTNFVAKVAPGFGD